MDIMKKLPIFVLLVTAVLLFALPAVAWFGGFGFGRGFGFGGFGFPFWGGFGGLGCGCGLGGLGWGGWWNPPWMFRTMPFFTPGWIC